MEVVPEITMRRYKQVVHDSESKIHDIYTMGLNLGGKVSTNVPGSVQRPRTLLPVKVMCTLGAALLTQNQTQTSTC